MEASIRASEIIERRTMGAEPVIFTEPEPVPVAPPAPATPPAAAVSPAKPLISTLTEKGEDEKEAPFFEFRATIANSTHQVMGQERGTLRRFREVCGDRPMDAYRREDITAFLATLRQLPKTYGKSPKDRKRSLAAIIAEAKEKTAERLTDKTIKRHLSTLSVFFKWAMDQGHLTKAAWAELVEEHGFKAGRGAKDQRAAWLPADLVKLFGSPIWKVPGFRNSARFWLPILALFHGARLEEFADLYRQDIGCDNGTWFISIREHGNRRLKNAYADRTVPLHPELIRLAFPEYVEKVAPKPDCPLFPDIAPQGRDGKRGPRMTRWFVEYRRRIGLYQEGVGMHAFRHLANTRLRDAMTTEQHKRHINYLLGHSQGSGEGESRYDKGPGLKALAETLSLLRYPELDLSHLYVGM